MHRVLKGKLVIGLAALVVIALAGGAYAATQSSGPANPQAFLNDVAKRLHVTPQQLTAALNGAAGDQLQAEVKAGRLTQAQANALKQRLKQKGATAPVPFGFFGPPGLAGPGGLRKKLAPAPGAAPAPAPGLAPGGVPAPGGKGRSLAPRLRALPAPFFPLGVAAGSAASYLGLTDAKLMKELSSGKSLAQIATAQHKSVSGLEGAILSSMKTRLDKAVKAKMLTSAQERKMLSNWQKLLARQVNQKGFQIPRLRTRALRFHGTMPAPKAAVPPAGLQVPAPVAGPPTA